MYRYFLLPLFLFLSIFTNGQSVIGNNTDSLTNQSLDSVINHIQLDKTKLILTKTGGLIIDSALFRKASYTSNKKKVKITFADNTNITIKAHDFWGLVTDFGQCQRFYKGNTYIVWHTKPPYIYRDYAAADYKIKYFYSKTLVSEIVPLTKENVYEIADAKTIAQLQAYLKTHDIEKSKDGISLGDGNGLPFAEVFSDDDDETPELFDLFVFHLKLHIYVIIICAEILESSQGSNTKVSPKH